MDVLRYIIFIFCESLTYELIWVTEDSKKNDALHVLTPVRESAMF